MATIGDLLNQVWLEFRKVGISYDLAIIEHIAAFLLEINGLESSEEELQPRKSSQANLDTEKIKQLLSEAANIVGGAAKLLDSHIVFSLPNMLPGGGYPTPRHIVKTMTCLAKVEPAHSLADFTCGSAGLLVNHSNERQGMTLGVDISSEWAKLAYANIKLHGLNARILHHNALSVFLQEEELEKTNFDRILINPPFGEKIDANLAERSLGQKVGSRSETALLALALQKLAPNGQAAVLAPSGLLFSNSTAEAFLRHQLVDENSLKAVISFPKDAFQPYSSLQTYLLLFSKSNPSEEHLTWFCQVEYDGYPSGRGRDLTQQPSKYSDLPFLEKFIVNFETDSKLEFPNQENALIAVRKITDGANLLGIVCRGITSQLTSILIHFYPSFEKQPPLLLLETATTEQSLCIQILLDVNAESSVVENRLEFIEKRKQNKKDSDPGIKLLSQSVKARGIAIALFNQVATIPEARLLGMAVEINAIKEQSYDLRPERYIGKQEELRLADSPTQILTRIYGNQRQLQERIDSLFGRLEMSPIAGLQIPSPLLEVEPFGIFSEEQTIIWEKIRKKTELITPEKPDNGLTAVHFTPEDIEISDTGEVSDTNRQTIDLLECMGIIVPVTIADTKTGESIAFYRRVTERDKWDLDSQGSVLTGGSQ
ncbi:HsdM family class I SAM-dependent methyltransferase [Nostoc sp.]|uniref:HsdM family class I SAM-dependent methyltransferase n=1 Tax=Nostoc sp. TaxID=1180 RepID=UPI002FF6DF27